MWQTEVLSKYFFFFFEGQSLCNFSNILQMNLGNKSRRLGKHFIWCVTVIQCSSVVVNLCIHLVKQMHRLPQRLREYKWKVLNIICSLWVLRFFWGKLLVILESSSFLSFRWKKAKVHFVKKASHFKRHGIMVLLCENVPQGISCYHVNQSPISI